MAYAPSGPVAARFLASDAFIRGIMGPVGSGKTGGCLMDMLYRGMRQAPHPRDRVRRTKFAVIRDTYRQLEKTTIPSWKKWVPESFGRFVGGSAGSPATHTVEFKLPDETTAEIIVEFIGLGDNSAADVMPGWEGTGAYMNEADKQARETLTYVRGRVGRYPAVDAGAGFAGASWRGVWLDFNAPDTEHWLYDELVENPVTQEMLDELGIDIGGQPPLAFFQQPGAMIKMPGGRYVVNPAAENLKNLVNGYYGQQIFGQPAWYIRRMVLNQWGASRDGQPVYEEFNDELHVSPEPLEPVRGLKLYIGADAGLTPAIVILQRMPNGQWRALDELIAPATGMGAMKFSELLTALLASRYRAWASGGTGGIDWLRADEGAVEAYGDPSASARSPTDEQNWLQIMGSRTRIPFRQAPSNSLTPRLEAVRLPLSRLIDGQPGLLISPTCKVLRKGFNSGYRFKRIKAADGEKFSDLPDKNEFSHVHDALQYGLLGGGEYRAAMGRDARSSEAPRQTRAYDEDYPESSQQHYGERQAYAD